MGEVAVEDGWFLSNKQGRDDDVQELIPKIKNINIADPLGNTALHYSGGHAKCVELLVNAKANLNCQNKTGDTPLHKARKKEKITYFFKAAWKGSTDCAKLLVSAGADVTIKNVQGETPQQVAKNSEIASLLQPVSQRLWDDDEEEEEDANKKKKKNTDDEEEEDDD